MKINKVLVEDKVVKFNDDTYPKFGWCVILCGGPGSGKSTVLGNLVPINAKVYNADKIKEYAVKRGEIVDNELILNGKHYPLDGIEPPYDLSNSEYVSFLHSKLKPLNKVLKKNMFELGISAEDGRLPNIAFDMTGSEIDDFENIIFQLKDLGYKFCVVFVLNELETALENNRKRSRKVLKKVVVPTFRDVMKTILILVGRKDLTQHISDFWTILPTKFDIHTADGKLRFIKSDNVKKITFGTPNAIVDQVLEMVSIQLDKAEEAVARIESGEDTDLY